MKQYPAIILSITLIVTINSLKAQESFAPVAPLWVAPDRDSSISDGFSQDEIAAPALGKFTKRYLRELRAFRAEVASLLAHLSGLGNAVNPLCITRCQALLNGVDVAIASEKQADAVMTWQMVLDAWPAMRWVAEPNELSHPDTHLEWVYDSFHNCVRDHEANIPDKIAAAFVKVFTERRFFPEREDWIGSEEWRVFPSDMWVCNPAVTLEILKSINPEETDKFDVYGDLDEIYGQDSSAEPLYKARYTANREQIRAKYAEFKAWLNSMDVHPPFDEISKQDVIVLKTEGARLGRLIELVEYGTSGKNHALFPKLKAYKTSLDHLASTAKIVDIKDMILAKVPFEEEWLRIQRIMEGTSSDEAKKAAVDALGLPAFFHDLDSLLTYPHGEFRRMAPEGASATIADLYARYGLSVAGNMPTELFEFEYLWVAKPEDGVGEAVGIAADVFVLFPDQMTARVKTLPLAERQRVLNYKGNLLDTPTKFFGVFTEEPDDHPDYVLNRYQAQKADIDFKYSALIQWHQSQPNGQ